VEHERKSLGGGQGLEHHEQRETDRVGYQGLVVGVDVAVGTDDRIGHVCVQRFLAPRPARAQHVEAHPPDDGGQPAAEVLDPAGVGTRESHPGLLDGIVRLAQRAQHPVGHGPQVGPVLLESLRQPDVLVLRCGPS
jgi:hypothetical protein